MAEPDERRAFRQEPDVVSAKWILVVATGAILLSIGLATCARWRVTRLDAELADHRRVHEPVTATPSKALETQLFDTEEPSEGRRAADEDRTRLHSWGWVDREAGVVHIPIDTAIEVVAARGGQR